MAWSLPEDVSLGFFVRRPIAGTVKTRLAADLGADIASAVYEAFLLDLVDYWSDPELIEPTGRMVLAYTPPDAGPWFDAHVPQRFALRPQVGDDLGSRMADFFEGEFEHGASRVVLLGSDSPTLDATLVVSALLCLEANDLVLGPAVDGGYYLIGARPPVPPIFQDIDWGSPRVLSQTVASLRDSSLRLAVLPPWYDVDTPQQWDFLVAHLEAMRRAGMKTKLPRLEALIERLRAESR